jgi:hypothetical protein
LPAGSTIRLHGLPSAIGAYGTKIPHAKTVSYLQDYSIESWLKLANPNDATNVVVESRAMPAQCPSNIGFQTDVNENGRGGVDVRLALED